MSASKEYKPAHGGYPGTLTKANPVRLLLVQALAVIADPKHWTQKSGARDAAGDHTQPFTDAVGRGWNPPVCFCAMGALWSLRSEAPADGGSASDDHITAVFLEDEARGELLATLGKTDETQLYDWNDDPKRSHDEVVDLFNKTIARLPEQVVA